MLFYNDTANTEPGELQGHGQSNGAAPTTITGLCDVVKFTSLSELLSGLGVGGGGGACAAVASDDEVVAVDR
jgi:hypothetical protein